MKYHLFQAAVAALLICAGFAGPAEAQGGARRTQLADPPNEPRDIRVLHDFSRCAARRWGNRARAILAMDHRTEDYRVRIHRFAREQWPCAPRGELRFGQMLFAGGMAETLLRERLRSRSLAVSMAPDPARSPVLPRDRTEQMSLCTVRAVPAQVAALLETEAASAAENAALSALVPEVSRCLARGDSVAVNRVSLRALLALAAYRLSGDPGAPPAPPAARPESERPVR